MSNHLSRLVGKLKESHILIAVFIITLGYYSVLHQLMIVPRHQLSGDEPEYLLIAYSLMHDFDLDLKNNFAQRHYQEFFPYPLSPHWAVNPGPKLYSFHAPGLPLVLIPFYALGKRRGAVFAVNLAAAFLAIQVVRLIRRYRGSTPVALGTWAVMFFTLPLTIYGGLIYPEFLGGLIFLTCILFIARKPTVSFPKIIAGAVLAGLLPWFHIRFAILGLTIAGYYLVRLIRDLRVFGFLGCYAAMGLLFLGHQYSMFGNPFHLLIFTDSSSFTVAAFKGVAGIFIDRVYGILPYSPGYLVLLFGIWVMYFRARSAWYEFIGLFLPYFYIVASRPIWWGGWCPAGRFLAPILPLCALPLAVGLRALPGWLVRIVLVVTLGYSLILQYFWVRQPLLLLSQEDGVNLLFKAIPFMAKIHDYLPCLSKWTAASLWFTIGWISGLVALLAFGHALMKQAQFLTKVLAGIAAIGLVIGTAGAVRTQRSLNQKQALLDQTPLARAAPVLLLPQTGEVFSSEPPVLAWEPVTGADAYRLFIQFPEHYSGEFTYRDESLRFHFPQSLWLKMPAGEYSWRVTPLKKERPGTSSRLSTFFKTDLVEPQNR